MTTINANITITQSYIDGVSAWPITINSGTASSRVVVRFGETLTITGGTNRYFQIGSQYITIDGSYNTVVISDIPNYFGLVNNGVSSTTSGYSNVTLQNIDISCIGTSSLYAAYSNNSDSVSGGYLCQGGYSRLATNNLVENCACFINENVPIYYAGILIGANASQSGSLTVNRCYTVGNGGNDAGLIIGGFAASGAGSTLVVSNSYSVNTSIASYGLGGIVGPYAASSSATTSRITIANCYNQYSGWYDSQGAMVGFGASSYNGSGYVVIRNCYSNTTLIASGFNATYVTQPNCYTYNGAWVDATANSRLITNTGLWVDISVNSTNVPWRLASSNPNISLYTPNTISSRKLTITTNPGALSSPYTYSLISVNGSGTIPAGFSINSSTGVITCSSGSSFSYTTRVMARRNADYGYAISNIIINGTLWTNPVVSCMCPDFSNNRLFVATKVSTAGPSSLTINGIGVLDLTTNTWGSINLNTNLAGNVYTMSLYNNNLFVGGSFYNVNSNNNLDYAFKYNIPSNNIAPISQTTLGSATATGSGTNRHGPSSSIVTETGTLYCHGKFGTTGSVITSGASLFPYYDFTSQTLYKRYSSVTTGSTGDGINTFYQVNDTDLYVGGNFTNLGGTSISYFAKGNTTTKTFTSVGTINNYISLSKYNPTNTTLYLFGAFTTINGSSVSYMSGYNTTTQTFITINGGLSTSNSVLDVSIDIPNQKLYLVGSFTAAGGLTLNATGFVIYNITTNTWTVPATLPNSPTTISMLRCAFNTSNGLVYIIPATTKNALYSYNPSSDTYTTITGANLLATSSLSSLSYNCMTYSSYNNFIYIGGVFDTCSGGGSNISCNNILGYDITNNTFAALDASGSLNGYTLGVQCMYFNRVDNNLYVGGGFNYVAGQKITNYAKYDVTSSTWSSIWPTKYSLIPADEQTVVSGTYVSGSGKVRPGYRLYIYNNGTPNTTMYMSTYTFDVNSTNNFNTFATIKL